MLLGKYGAIIAMAPGKLYGLNRGRALTSAIVCVSVQDSHAE